MRDEKFQLLTPFEFAESVSSYFTCLIFDDGNYPDLAEPLKAAIVDGRVWHLVVVGSRSSDIEDQLDDLIISADKLVMTSSLASYEFDEMFSLATMMPEGENHPMNIGYIYDGANSESKLIGEELAQQVNARQSAPSS